MYVAAAMVLGGGGSPAPGNEIILQVLFAAAIIAWVWMPCEGSEKRARIPTSLLIVGIVLLALPLLQLVPLPPSIWQALPVRHLESATLSLVGEKESWQPLTISRPRTVAAFLAILPAVGVMWAAATRPVKDRRVLLLAIATIGLVSALLGALQMASGPEAFRLYDQSHRGWLTGFHANRNAAADALLIASLALSAWVVSGRTRLEVRALAPLAAAQAVLFVALVMTGSRTGIALTIVTLAFHVLIFQKFAAGAGRRSLVGAMAMVGAVLIAIPVALSGTSRLASVAARFDVTGDARATLWQDTLAAILAFWPAGSGLGTFSSAVSPFEAPEHLDRFYPNRAHNDYFEFILETGVLAPLVMIGVAALIVMLARRSWRQSIRQRPILLFAIGTLAIVALHSIVDYPLRNMALACLAGVAAGMLVAAPRVAGGRAAEEGREQVR